ncbi:MAG: hypothetical protein CME88_07495 [Hirschia sp.]|nr:hypothetical protein [Hirschia sp.]MBF18205.1 hypothetical protein [Hirschia sp.]
MTLTPDDPAGDAQSKFEAMEADRAGQFGNAPPPPPREPLKPEQKWSLRLAFTLALLCPVFFAVAALGTRFGLWEYTFGLGVMSFQWGPILLMCALAMGVISLVLTAIRPPRRGIILALVAVLIPLLMLGWMKGKLSVAMELPPIHDVQTDWSRPISLPETNIALREANGWNDVLADPVVSDAAAGRWPDLVGERVADLQKQAYPDIKPLLVEAPPEVILEFAEGVAQKQGWTIQSVDEQAGRIHATSTSTWFGFTDDIVIRVTPQGVAGSRIDIRSVSRVGLSDLGANAMRVKGFIDDAHMAVRIIGESSEG